MGALITIEDVEIYLNSSISDDDPSTTTGEEALYTQLINTNSAIIEKYIGRTLEAADYTETHDGYRYCSTGEINTKQYPINSVTTIVVSDTTLSEDLEDYYVYDDYIASPYFNSGRKNIVITYNAGYSTIPLDVQQICIEMVVNSYRVSSVDTTKKEEKMGDYAYKLGDSFASNTAQYISIAHQNILDKYIGWDY